MTYTATYYSEDKAYTYIQSWMQTMLDAVCDTKTDNYKKYVDVDSFAKMYIIYEIVKNYDVISGSQFMYREGITEDDKLFAGPIWDLDNAFDRNGDCPYDGISNSTLEHSASGMVIDSVTPQNTTFSILQALGKHADFMERVYQLYNDYKADINALGSNVDTLKSAMTESVAMNFDRWDINQTRYNNSIFSSPKTFDSGTKYQYSRVATTTYENYIANLKNYLTARAAYLELTWGTTNPNATVTGEKTVFYSGDTLTFTATSGFDGYQWQLSKNGTKWNDIDGANTNVYTAKADKSFDGKYIRCVVKENGSLVTTTNVAKVNSSALTYAGPEDALHVHKFEEVVVLPTDTEEGYVAQMCSCELEKSREILAVIIYGDVNLDGKVNVSDCVLISFYLSDIK